MKQIFHIFEKDFDHLRLEIILMLAVSGTFIWVETDPARHTQNSDWVALLLMAAAAYLIARCIHAEPLCGDRQFWITRPYRWHNLLAAKFLFIAVFANLPVFLAQTTVMLVDGFPVSAFLPGLLWCQVMLLFGFSLPVAGLAALTSNIIVFQFILLVALFTWWFGVQLVLMKWDPMAFYSVDWVRNAAGLLIVMISMACATFLQYRSRRSGLTRIISLTGAVAALLIYVLLPWRAAFALQTQMSGRKIASDAIQVAYDPQVPRAAQMELGRKVDFDVPIAISGIPAGAVFRPDYLHYKIYLPDRKRVDTGESESASLKNERRENRTVIHGIYPIDIAFAKAHRDQRVHVTASFYFTVFGNQESRAVIVGDRPAAAVNGLQCYMGLRNDYITCRSAFRWPGRMVVANIPNTEIHAPFTTAVSYSPFPAGVQLNTVEAHWAAGSRDAHTAVISSLEPLGHFHRTLQIDGKLSDFMAPFIPECYENSNGGVTCTSRGYR